MKRGAQEVRSLLSEGYLYIGECVQQYQNKVTRIMYFRHTNGNRARIEVDNKAYLFINGKFKKIL